jgi:hypothetical protein
MRKASAASRVAALEIVHRMRSPSVPKALTPCHISARAARASQRRASDKGLRERLGSMAGRKYCAEPNARRLVIHRPAATVLPRDPCALVQP